MFPLIFSESSITKKFTIKIIQGSEIQKLCKNMMTFVKRSGRIIMN